MDGNGRARARRKSSSDDSLTGWSGSGERADLGLPLSFAVTGARAARPKRVRGSTGRRVDGGPPPARRGSRDAVAREFEAELVRVRMPELEAEAECVIDFDHDVTAGRSACDAWQGRWLYTAVEVGELLGCTTRYVRELVRRGEIHAVPIGRLVRIPAAEVEAFVARRLAGVDQSARPVLGRPGRPAPRPLAPTCDDELPPDLVW